MSTRKTVLAGVTSFVLLGALAAGYMITRGPVLDARPDHIEAHDKRAMVISDKGRHEEAERLFRETRERWQGDRYARERSSHFLSAVLAVQGRLAEGGEYYEDRRQYFLEEGAGGSYLFFTLEWSLIDLFVLGDPQKGIDRFNTAMEQVPWDSVPLADRPYIFRSMLNALAGDTDRARALLDEYEAEVSPAIRKIEQSYWHGSFVHIARGAIAQSEGRIEDAIASYQALARASTEYRLISLPMRALAEEMAEDPAAAIALYEEYVDATTMFRTMTDQQFLGGSLLRLASLYEEQGDLEKAAYYYERLAHLWRNADVELQHRVRFAENKARELTGTG